MSTPVEPAVAFAGAGADQHIVVSGDWVLGAVIRLQALVSAVLPVIPGTLARLDLSGIGRIDGAGAVMLLPLVAAIEQREGFALTGDNPAEVDGITGASVGTGRGLELTMDLADALFDAGYTLHIDAAAEEMRDSPNEIEVPLTSAGAGQPVTGRRYIADFTYAF